MVYRFHCHLHNLDLEGFPSWALAKEDPDLFVVSFQSFKCTEGGEENTCAEHWDIEVKTDIKEY